ncbi:hypothetical protein [Streptomyces sp. NPDC127020]|uniref:hypothetical protein n=1 Tax=Streptomyces sp. NPDC127020 TaxID=3347109 RepID=UPI00364B7340
MIGSIRMLLGEETRSWSAAPASYRRWILSADEAEAEAVREVAAGCPEQTVT